MVEEHPRLEQHPSLSDTTLPQQLGGVGLIADSVTESAPDPFETGNFVRFAPSIAEAAQDTSSRTTVVRVVIDERHISSDSMPVNGIEASSTEMTESQALHGFMSFLDEFESHIDETDVNPDEQARLLEQRKEESQLFGYDSLDRPEADEDLKSWMHRKIDALRETSYLGSSEIDEATAGLASYWKTFLAEDPERQIFLPELPVETSQKSYGYIAEKIFAQFSPEELESLKGRIVGSVTELDAPPEKTKVILLDDWMMSGDQIFQRKERSLEGESFFDDTYRKYEQSLEINLLAADENRIEDGSWYHSPNDKIPVKAYFKVPLAKDSQELDDDDRYFARITGAHSSADVHFAITVSNLVTLMKHIHPDREYTDALKMPPLTNVVREYRNLDPVLARQFVNQ